MSFSSHWGADLSKGKQAVSMVRRRLGLMIPALWRRLGIWIHHQSAVPWDSTVPVLLSKGFELGQHPLQKVFSRLVMDLAEDYSRSSFWGLRARSESSKSCWANPRCRCPIDPAKNWASSGRGHGNEPTKAWNLWKRKFTHSSFTPGRGRLRFLLRCVEGWVPVTGGYRNSLRSVHYVEA